MSPSGSNSISSLTRNPLGLRCRADLVAVETQHKYESAVVVKDPVAMKYHRMRPDEFFVLMKLDGEASLEQIREEYERVFAPTRVTAADLNRLLFRFHQSGLTISDTPMQGDRLTDRRRKDRNQRLMQHISGILFIRFPGVDPEPIMKRLYPLVRPLMSWFGVMAAMVLCVIAVFMFATRWDQFSAEFPNMGEWIRLEAVLILAAVIGGTKVLHELGHAVTCKHFGGECHQIGPMLLVFTPALYCDTSDSWMLPSRWQRAAVGLAGIGAEVVLAAIATIVWASTAQGLTHYVAMNVMLVCSVSTLLFNANPLLRYDGYYVLSDLCDVPNLGEQSRKLLSAHTSQIVFGVDEISPEPMTPWARFWMLTYALAAFCYRWGLTLLILWFVSIVLRPYGLESIGKLLCIFAAGGMLFTLFRAPFAFLRNPARRKLIQMKRTMISAVSIAALIAIGFYPLPSGVSASARIVPREETPIYITTPGILESVNLKPGTQVHEGDEIARLANDDVELQYLTIKGRYETQKQVVEAMRISAVDSPDAGNQLLAQKFLLEDLAKQLKTRESRREGLVIRASVTGTLIAAPYRASEKNSEHRLVSWSGYPTQQQNQSCFLEPGHELMSIATDANWDAELILSQSEVQRIELGADVKLVLESMPSRPFIGKVSDIARAKWLSHEHGERRDDPTASRRDSPPGTSYVVRVQLESSELPFVAGATVAGRIEAEPISGFGRASRFLNGLLRFR
jgi:putative peptide zinc metalloprotease protein